jgi:FixJ family two-component response regulator
MPGMSGLDLLTYMRMRGNDVPFVFVTAFPNESVRARALRAGAVCVLAKPFTGPVLIGCIETALNQPRGGAAE